MIRMALWLVLVGSPRPRGNSTRIAETIEHEIAERYPEDTIETYHIADMQVAGCNGCDYCKTHGTCVIEDDMQACFTAIKCADYLCIVSPIYFAGVPSQFKAVLDRLQPLYWDRQDIKAQHLRFPPKRPAVLYLVGEGGDPYGYKPAAASVKASFAMADIAVRKTIPLIGSRPMLSPEDVVLPAEEVDAQSLAEK